MKLQIDFSKKIIKLESNVKLKEFIEKIQTILPDWEDYTLDSNTVINWNYYPSYIYPSRNTWYNNIVGFSDLKTATGDVIIKNGRLTITNSNTESVANNNVNVLEKPNTIVNFEL